MVQRNEIVTFLNTFLRIDEFEDSLPNGLQVEGKPQISKILTAVSASLELFERALGEKAEMVIVHHGMFFKKDSPVIAGGLRRRLRILLENELNLLAYHLPLDAHPEIGHSALGGRALNLQNIQPFETFGITGEVDAIAPEQFFQDVKALYGANVLIFPFGPERIRRVALISGGAQHDLARAITAGMDVYITGEASEFVMHVARENNIHFIAAGHYATERPGMQKLAELVSNRFAVTARFIDIPNPV